MSPTAALAQLERDLTSERTIAALAHMRSQGQRVGQVPYGFTLAEDGVHLVELAEEQTRANQIRQLRVRGLSYSRIARRLTVAGVPSRSGRPWHAQSVYNIANRPAV